MEVIFIIGSNTKESHPVIANRMIKAYRNGARIILADPRGIPMARFAEVHLQLRPGTDLALLNGIARVIVKEGLKNTEFIRDNTQKFEEWEKSLEPFTPEYVESVTGVPAGLIVKAARLYGGSRKAGLFYTMGITQHTHGTDNVSAVANLALVTGNIGRESTGINPLRGQNNVQGACDSGALPNVYPGYQKVNAPENREKFEKAWGPALPDKPGLTATEMFNGSIKALYIMGENPVLTDANQGHVVHALEGMEFIVVQDIFMTETAKLADVVLPAACFAEKEGTFTNTERRVQLVRKAVNPPGEAREDLSILMGIAGRIGLPASYCGAEDVFAEMGSLWQGVQGITYGRLRRGGIQWPCPSKDHPGTRYLYKTGFPVGRPPFTVVPFTPPAELPDAQYPYLLTTGRNLFQYHSGSMTRRVRQIEEHAGRAYAEISPADAAALGVKEGDVISITSRRGTIDISARVTGGIRKGIVFIPMHYAEAAANVITNNALDPVAKIPEFKACAARIEKKTA